jgi:hypothetical protein
MVRDASGNVYVTGHSNTTWGTPLRTFTAGTNTSGNKTADVFMAKVDLTSSNLPSATLISPLAAVTTTKPTFIWSKVSGATYYRLWIKNSSSIWVMQALYYGANICGATNCAITPTPSLVNGAYTWYIQALNTTQSSAWTWHAFSVAIPAPGIVTLVSPKGTTHLSKPTFIWSKDSVATHYRLWIKNASGTWILQNLYFGKNICGVTNCAIVSPITLANGAYTWYIDTLTATQNGQWSAQAITVSVPDIVPSPSNNETGVMK